MATDYSSENPRSQLAKLQAEQPHMERLTEAATMWETAQQRISDARLDLYSRTNDLVYGSWRDDAGQAFAARVEESIMSMIAWDHKIDDSGVIGHIKTLQADFPHCVAQVQAIAEQLDAAQKAQALGGGGGIDPAMVEREFSKFAAQFTNHIADLFEAVTRAMGVLGDLPEWNGPRQEGNGEQGSGDQGNGDQVEQILNNARGEIGVQEEPPGSNQNPYGPTAAWCSSFATEMWRRSGVDIPKYPFTGDVYTWGEQNGKAFDANNLNQARPGDVLLFGTGPESPDTSTHIGIVESVDGDQVTLIEGNASDQVMRNTHTLSSDTFYGGVHP
jgi:hypothetical protein